MSMIVLYGMVLSVPRWDSLLCNYCVGITTIGARLEGKAVASLGSNSTLVQSVVMSEPSARFSFLPLSVAYSIVNSSKYPNISYLQISL